MRTKRGGFSFFWFLSSVLVILFFSSFPSTPLLSSFVSFQLAPLWWEITIDLKTEGGYKLEGSDSSYVGNYVFIIRWTGSMEKDDHDYLLYRFNCLLSRWDARETASTPKVRGILTTPDFKEKPSFDVKYILRKADDLHLDFIVNGIVFPQDSSEYAFPLLFPSSEENRQHPLQIDYNACVMEGSNSVFLKEAEIYAGPVAKDYSWTWRHQQWLLKQRGIVLAAQSHQAKVTLSIIPHYARPE